MSKTLSLSAAVFCAALLLSTGLNRCPGAETPTVEQKIEQELEKPTQLEFIETPLQDVIDYLKKRHGIEIQVDRKALGDVGLDPSTLPITKNLKGLSLRSALRLTLHDLDLVCLVEDEVLLITTPEEAETRLTTKFYPVADLIASQDKSGEKGHRDELVHAITTTVEPTSWRSVGGPGSVATTSFHGTPTLVVRQSYHVHRAIAAFLEEQRKLLQAEREAVVPRCPVADIEMTPTAEKIEKTLKQPTEFSFIETPLADVVDYLKKKHEIEIQIDRKALSDVGLDPSTTPITKGCKGISLRSALRLLLRELDLTYTIEDEVLLITTPEEAESRLTTRIYAVGDLPAALSTPDLARQRAMQMWSTMAQAAKDAGGAAGTGGDRSVGSVPQPNSIPSMVGTLADMITWIVEPTSWEMVGGPGNVVSGSVGGVEVLIVTQTQDAHEEIGRVLEKLRESLRCNRPTAAPAPKPAADEAAPDEAPKAPAAKTQR